MGSKARIAKYILPIILKDRKEGQWYVEPFVGGANTIDKVDGNRLGSDVNNHVIRMLKLIVDNPNSIPRSVADYTESMYNNAVKSDEITDVDCLALFQYSFGAKFKGGWARNKRGTDYVRECVKNLLLQSRLLKGVVFISKSYDELVLKTPCIIYCDPPYSGVTGYKDKFDSARFWQWCRDMASKGHQVFVSEYNAPDDFECIWEGELKSTLSGNGKSGGTKLSTEKLFTFKTQLDD